MKKLIAGTLIIGSLTFAGLILFNIQSSPTEKTILENNLSGNTKSHNEQLGALEENAKLDPSKNATLELAAKIGKELVSNNPEGPQSIDGQNWLKTATPDELVNKLLQEKLTSFDAQSLMASVKLTDLKLIPDNSPAAIKTYVQNFQNIIAKNILVENSVSSTQNNQNATIASLKSIFQSYNKIIPELYKLEIPSKLAATHQEGIKILATQKNIIEKIINSAQDPVSAILAINLLPAVNDQVENFFQKKLVSLVN